MPIPNYKIPFFLLILSSNESRMPSVTGVIGYSFFVRTLPTGSHDRVLLMCEEYTTMCELITDFSSVGIRTWDIVHQNVTL